MPKEQKSNLILLKTLVGLIVLASFWNIVGHNNDPDLGIHLRHGRFVLENWRIPYTDTFSYTLAGYPWVHHEWLTDTFTWWLVKNQARIIWIGLCVLFSFLPLAHFIRRANSKYLLAIVVLSAAILIQYIGQRPQLISFFLFFVLLNYLTNKAFTNRQVLRPTALIYLPLLFWLWANLHAGFGAGLIILLIYLFWDKTAWQKWPQIRQRLGATILVLLATLINPFTWRLYAEMLHVNNPLVGKYINEWKPFNWEFGPTSFSLALLVGLFISLIIIRRQFGHRDLLNKMALTNLVFFLLAITANRLIIFFLITNLFFVFMNWPQISARQRLPLIKNIGWLGLMLSLALLAKSFTNITPRKSPLAAIAYLQEVNRSHPLTLFNEYTWGGDIIYNSDLPVFVDGRMPHWQRAASYPFADFIGLMYEDSGRWQTVFARWQINAVLISPPKVKTEKQELYDSLLANGWHVSYRDGISVVLLPQKE